MHMRCACAVHARCMPLKPGSPTIPKRGIRRTPARGDHHETHRFRRLERRPEGRQRHPLDRERRARGRKLQLCQALRRRKGHQSRGADRRGPCRLLLDAALGRARRRWPDRGRDHTTSAAVTGSMDGGGFTITDGAPDRDGAKVPGADAGGIPAGRRRRPRRSARSRRC